MKLNVRLILITFIIVLVTSVASTYIYYSLSNSLLSKYQSQAILNSTNDFVFTFQNALQQPEEDFNKLKPSFSNISNINLDSTSIDFLFTLVSDSLINMNEFTVKASAYLNIKSRSFRQFFVDNPNVVLIYTQLKNSKTIYYGYVISAKFLEKIAESIRAGIALVINDFPVEISNPDKNQKYFLSIIKASRELRYKENYDIYGEELASTDFKASLYTPRPILTPGGKINFVIFNTFTEGVDFRTTLRTIMLLFAGAGSALTFIFVFLFTIKLRKQISLLSKAAEITSKGNFEHRVTVITKDEVGKLGEAFNSMLEELEQKRISEKEYTEFITLINQNPTLKEVSEAALSKIIKSTGLTFGVLYIIEQKSLRLISSFGISRNLVKPTQENELYRNVMEKMEVIEFNFQENFPEIKTGLASIKIKYLLLYPIVYYKETIAILELASESTPQLDIKLYIANIQEQLAVGLINARSLEQLENLVSELRRLNDVYQKQNRQIIEQNELLKELHKQLSEKAEELERQRTKAVELTKVKSQFLASMSHELKTPLISILGLTELILKDGSVPLRFSDRIKIVNRNGKKLLDMITNILEFSKFESGKIEIKKESFLITDLAEDIRLNMEQLAGEKNLKFSIETPKNSSPLINTDKNKLEQVLTNLLINAIKFTEKGEVKLVIKLLSQNKIEFSVIDTGIGISEENKQLIFSEFRQIDGTTTRKFGGAGLGLAICKRYVELLGGNLTLQSELGNGSCFSFVLEDIVLEVIEAIENKFLSYDDTKTVNKPDNKKALIISNNSDTNKLIEDYLTSFNYKITVSKSGAEGISLANDLLPQSIILCPQLDDANVWTVISRLKNNPITQEIPIILLTILEQEKVGWVLNAYDFLVNPITENTLKNITLSIEKYLHSKIDEIFFFDANKSECEQLKDSLGKSFDLHCIASIDSAIDEIKKGRPQLIIIDLDSFKSGALKLSSDLRQNKLTKDIPVVLIIPQIFSEKFYEELDKTLGSIALKEKNHPLDVLKDLKDRIIDDTVAKNKHNLIEEISRHEIHKAIKEKPSGTKPTILLVDDDSDSLFTIGEFLNDLNCQAIFAHNGVECLLTLNHIRPDLILLDIMMPQMDGFETIRRIRSDSKHAHIPVIALTAYAMLDNIDVIHKNGFNDILTKPINSNLLASKIQPFLKTRIKNYS